MSEFHSNSKSQMNNLCHYKFEWGEQFIGTKAQLQEAGFLRDKPYPGEPGGNKRKVSIKPNSDFAAITVEKKRDFDAATGQWIDRGIFKVDGRYVRLERTELQRNKSDFAPGVTRHEGLWADVFVGDATSLIAAGLVTDDQLPGKPNCGKVRTTFLADGTRCKQGSSESHSKKRLKTVRTFGKKIAVDIYVPEAIYQARHAEYREEWARADQRLSVEYARLIALRSSQPVASKPKAHLRLVWSA